jgi:four helix bundle protein
MSAGPSLYSGSFNESGSGLALAEAPDMTPAELRKRFAAFAADVARFAKPLLSRPETYDAARQLIRSSASAADNHRAAGRARTHAEFTSRLGVALDEADEAKFWLEYLRNTEFVEAERIRPFHTESQELVAILTKSFETARNRDINHPRRGRTPHRENRPGQPEPGPPDSQ